MPDENAELVRRVFAQWELGRMTAGVEILHPDIVFESYMPDSGERVTKSGLDGLAAFMREFLAQWHDYRMTAEQVHAIDPDTVLVEGMQSAVGRSSGVLVEMPAYSVWFFEDDKVVRLIFETDLEKARSLAGLG